MSTNCAITDKNEIGMYYLGFGTHQCSVEEAYENTMNALKAGYRHIDTAEAYFNEEGVGKAIQESGIPRKELFVTTKLFPGGAFDIPVKTFDTTLKSIETSCKKLNVDCIDLYLIHNPLAKENRLEQWRAVVEAQKRGLVKHAGVSNYGLGPMKEILDSGLPLPRVNQIEIHPLCTQTEILAFMDKHNILPVAYSSLSPMSSWRAAEGQGGSVNAKTEGKLKGVSVIQPIAEKLGVSEAQILLRWGLQHKYPILPTSSNPARIKNNTDLYGFNISDEDMKALDGLNCDLAMGWDSFMPMNPVKDID